LGSEGGGGGVGEAEVDVFGTVPRERLMRADRVVLGPVMLGSFGELDGVVDVVEEESFVLEGAEPAFA
jgi:hypothetical protein